MTSLDYLETWYLSLGGDSNNIPKCRSDMLTQILLLEGGDLEKPCSTYELLKAIALNRGVNNPCGTSNNILRMMWHQANLGDAPDSSYDLIRGLSAAI